MPRALRRDGSRVRVLARSPAAALKRVGPHAEIVPGDVTRKETLVPAFAGTSHVIFTAGIRSGHFARQSVVRATEYDGVLNTIEAARAHNFRGRFVYMTSIGVTRQSLFVTGLNIWKLLNGLRPDPRWPPSSILQDGPNADAEAPAPGS